MNRRQMLGLLAGAGALRGQAPPPAAGWRDIANGSVIPDEGYADQPYIVHTADGKWLCVLTTGKGGEGEGGQHVISTISAIEAGLGQSQWTWSQQMVPRPVGRFRSRFRGGASTASTPTTATTCASCRTSHRPASRSGWTRWESGLSSTRRTMARAGPGIASRFRCALGTKTTATTLKAASASSGASPNPSSTVERHSSASREFRNGARPVS